MPTMRWFASVVSVALVACTSSSAEELCGRFGLVPDFTTDSCRCPDGTVESDDESGCVLADGGFLPFPDAGARDDAGVDAAVTPDAGCPNGAERECSSGSDEGECARGVEVCAEGSWGPCVGSVEPVPEICDGRDNDCDGVVDGPSASAACGLPPQSRSAVCSAGACVVMECAVGSFDCDLAFANGCEARLGTEAACTACGDVCGWRCEEGGCDDAEAVTAGSEHSCALRQSGRVVCWGSNVFGQVGDASFMDRRTPVPVSLESVEAVSAGGNHTCALHTDGSVSCWGANNRGQLGLGGGSDRGSPQVVSGIDAVRSLSAGFQHTCAVRTIGGGVWCWGMNSQGQVGNDRLMTELRPVQALDVSSAVRVAAGQSHSCAVLSTGRVRCWGANTAGQIGDGTTERRMRAVLVEDVVSARAVVAGSQHSCALLMDGTVRCWGSNEHGQVGDGGMENRLTGTQVPGLSNVVAIASSASATHTCAIRDDGTVWCWGQNQFGQIGDGTDVTRRMATRVPDLRAGSVSANVANTCAATDAGAVVCWGDNTSGQLGTGTTTFSWSPVAASAP